MIIYLEVECMMYEGHSLKDKRSIIKRALANIQKKLNVAVTELDFHDLWQRTKIGIVTISTDKVHAEKIIQQAIAMLDSIPELERTITNVERL